MLKALINITIIAGLLSGCASIKGSISNTHKADIYAKVDSSSFKKADSLKSENENLKTQLDQQRLLNEQKDVQSKVIEDDAELTLAGGTTAEGVKGNGATSISQMVVRGRVTAISTYYYKNDSICTQLTVGDTVINIHRKTIITSDKSNVRSESDTHNNSQSSASSFSAVSAENNSTASILKDKKTADTVKASFAATIGIGNWWPVIIAMVIGLGVGITLGRKSKK